MKRKLFALFLALCLMGTATPAFALLENDDAVQTVRALNIMTGDEKGNLNLAADVKRSEFAKLLVAASASRDKVGAVGAPDSPYSDVADGHWALPYIQLVTQQGWMNGYGDSTFRPDSTITLEEACTATLRLLGNNTEKLGAYPEAQLNKAGMIGLRKDIALPRGGVMTRGDCAQMFYNLMTAENAKGKVYATTLGYTVTNGELNLTSAIIANLDGPHVAAGADALPFVPAEVLLDGEAVPSYTIKRNDVYYYHEGLRSVWVFTKQVSGKVEAVALSSAGMPTSVTIFKTKYTIGTSDAAYQLSELSGTVVNSYVTLLLGMNNAVVGVLKGTAVSGAYHGMVKSYTRASNQAKAAVETTYNVFCTDGVTRTFSAVGDNSFSPGTIVTATVGESGVSLSRMAPQTVAGEVDLAASRIGDTPIAGGIRVIETESSGHGAVVVDLSRLANVKLTGSDVRSSTRNAAGEVDNLILNDVTGDAATYGYLTAAEFPDKDDDDNIYTYTCCINGRTSSYYIARDLPIRRGAVSVLYNSDGTVKDITNLASVKLTGLSGTNAEADGKAYGVWENAQVYLQKGSDYYLTPLESVNAKGYNLTGWYDSSKAGGLIRVLTAVEKK